MTCDPAVQRDRMLGRGTAPDDIARRIAAQAGLAARLAPIATRVIDTSGSTDSTAAAALDALREALEAHGTTAGI